MEMSDPAPPLPYNDVLGPDSSDDEPLVAPGGLAGRKKVKPVKRERSASASAEHEPGTKKAMHVKRERSASAPAELEPPTIVINDHDDDVLSLTRRAGFAGRVLSASMHSCWVHCSHFWMESHHLIYR